MKIKKKIFTQYAKLKTKEQIMKKNIYPYMAGGLALLGIAAATPFTPIPQDNAQPAGSFATDTGTYYYTNNGTPVEVEKETLSAKRDRTKNSDNARDDRSVFRIFALPAVLFDQQ